MGKGDQKSKRGKIIRGTYGVRRKKKAKKAVEVVLNLENLDSLDGLIDHLK